MSLRVAHPYLDTRVTLFAAHLLDRRQVAAALGRPRDELRELFRRCRAEPLLATGDEAQRRSTEQRRLSLLLDDVVVLSRALTGRSREFLLYWTHLFELINLKAIVRGRLSGQDPRAIRTQLLDMGPFSKLPVDDLLRAENENEMLRRLENTAYAEIASQARRVMEQQRDLFFVDTTFDRRFYSGLVKRAEALHSHDPEAMRRMLTALIDGTNLTWLLRYRFVYRLPAAEAYFLLIPSGYRLRAGTLGALASKDGTAAVLAALPAPLDALTRGLTTIEEVNARMARWLRRECEWVLRRSRSAFCRAFAHLILRERDLRILRGIVKGEELGVSLATQRQALRLREPDEEAPGV
ncbi:MAG TPA: V-type ATPase subunit [Pelomicrobium sp.]|nr:V-type ATPase subunit [Pelomicrobium sp.]